jgi:asparaginyl-tRNA synthetase
MSWVYIEDIGKHQDQEVEIRGWLYNKRSGGKIRFLLIRDGTGIIQCTAFNPEKDNPLFQKIDTLTQESSIIIHGQVRKDKRAQGGFEISIKDVEILQIAEEYPITPKEHGIPFLMDHRHLWLRSKKQNAVLQIRAELIRAIRDFFDGRGFRNMDTPILTPSAISAKADSCIMKPQRLRLERSTVLARPFVPKNQRPGNTLLSSGWWNLRSLLPD